MYDVYGSTVVVSSDKYNKCSQKEKQYLLKELIVKGYKKIFLRGHYCNQFRTLNLTWISPYKEPEFSTKFIHKEGNYYIYGDLKEVYYNPRYHYEREEIKKLFDLYVGSTLAIIGSGISPYSLYLSDSFKISEFEINEKAHHYSNVNLSLNKKSIVERKLNYDYVPKDIVLSMIPLEKQFHKHYNFTKFCVFYVLLNDKELEDYKKEIILNYDKKVEVKKIRDYSKTNKIYRFMINSDTNDF